MKYSENKIFVVGLEPMATMVMMSPVLILPYQLIKKNKTC